MGGRYYLISLHDQPAGLPCRCATGKAPGVVERKVLVLKHRPEVRGIHRAVERVDQVHPNDAQSDDVFIGGHKHLPHNSLTTSATCLVLIDSPVVLQMHSSWEGGAFKWIFLFFFM